MKLREPPEPSDAIDAQISDIIKNAACKPFRKVHRDLFVRGFRFKRSYNNEFRGPDTIFHDYGQMGTNDYRRNDVDDRWVFIRTNLKDNKIEYATFERFDGRTGMTKQRIESKNMKRCGRKAKEIP